MQLALPVQILLSWACCVWANVEKTIFIAPKAIEIYQSQPNLNQLNLETLTPSKPTLRRQITAAFPTLDDSHGPASWFLLDALREGARHEVRVCWLATVSKS